jgi:hypothetical protein
MSATFENAHDPAEIPEHTLTTCYLALKGGGHALAYYSPRVQGWVDNGAIQPIEMQRIVAWWYLPRRAKVVEVGA